MPMTALTDGDVAASIAIAIVLLIVAICVWPGFGRVRAADLEGFWGTTDGALNEIRVVDGALVVRSGAHELPGRLCGLRSLCVGGACGRVGLGGGQIHWSQGRSPSGGDATWYHQGVR
jgi:hypothetical protein